MRAPRPIFVPGVGSTPRVFAAQREVFESSEAIDLPGHGDAPGPPLGTVAAHAERLLGQLGPSGGPPVLVGHSLGGAIAIEAALAAPDRIAGLVLVATGARLPVPDDAMERVRSDFGAECDRLASMCFAPGAQEAIARRRKTLARIGPEALEAGYAASAGFDRRDRLGEVRAPALVIAGADDRLTPPWLGEELARGLPGAHMVVVEGAGHMVTLERDLTVNLLIAGYLARLELTMDQA
jgi:pimeloyl-ACP methyl ester carboxylesterase